MSDIPLSLCFIPGIEFSLEAQKRFFKLLKEDEIAFAPAYRIGTNGEIEILEISAIPIEMSIPLTGEKNKK